MSIYLGSKDISSLSLGGKEVKEVWLGGNLVWPSGGYIRVTVSSDTSMTVTYDADGTKAGTYSLSSSDADGTLCRLQKSGIYHLSVSDPTCVTKIEFAPEVDGKSVNVNVEDCSYLFSGWKNVTSVTGLRTKGATSFRELFCNCWALTEADVENYDTSSVTSLRDTFKNAGFTSLDLTGWDTSNVTEFFGTFMCTGSTQGGINSALAELVTTGWDTSKGVIFRSCFYNCTSLTELDISSWDTSEGREFFLMFFNVGYNSRCKVTGTIDLRNWLEINYTMLFLWQNYGNILPDYDYIGDISYEDYRNYQNIIFASGLDGIRFVNFGKQASYLGTVYKEAYDTEYGGSTLAGQSIDNVAYTSSGDKAVKYLGDDVIEALLTNAYDRVENAAYSGEWNDYTSHINLTCSQNVNAYTLVDGVTKWTAIENYAAYATARGHYVNLLEPPEGADSATES